MPSKRKYDLTVAAVYAGLLLAVVSPFLLFNRSLYLADVTYNFEPIGTFIRQTYSDRGGFSLLYPLWNPYVLGGAPLSNVMWPIGYLPGYVSLQFSSPVSQGLLLFFHLFVAGFGGYIWQSRLLMRRENADGENATATDGENAAATDGENAAATDGENATATDGENARPLPYLAGAFFGLIFMLSGYMVGSTINLPLVFTASWIPLILYCIDRMPAHPFALSVGLAGLLMGQQLTAGRIEIVAASCALYGAYALYSQLNAKCEPNSGMLAVLREKSTVLLLTTLLCAFLTAVLYDAVNLIPLFENLTSNPFIAGFEAVSALMWSAGWYEFAGLLFSQPLGAMTPEKYDLYPTYPGSMPYITSLYLGAPVLMLAAIGFLTRQWRMRWFWLSVAVVASFVALGHFLPLVPALYANFPSLALVRFPAKLMVFVTLAVCVAAAHGFWSVFSSKYEPKQNTGPIELSAGTSVIVPFAVAWLVLAVFGMFVWFTDSGKELMESWLPGVVSGWTQADKIMQATAITSLSMEFIAAGLSGALASIVLLLHKRIGIRTGALLITTMAGALLAGNACKELDATVDASFFEDKQELADLLRKDPVLSRGGVKVLSLLEHPLPSPDIVTQSGHDFGGRRFMAYARDVLLPNTNVTAKIAFAGGMPVVPTWTSIFLQTGILPRSSQLPDQKHPAGKSDVPLFRFCQSTATRYIITLDRVIDAETGAWNDVPYLDKRLFRLVHLNGHLNVRVFAVYPTRQRVFLTDKIIWVPSRQEALTRLNRADENGFDPQNEVMLVGAPSPPSEPSEPSSSNETNDQEPTGEPSRSRMYLLSVEDKGSEEVIIKVRVAKPAAVVLTESYAPGWVAYDNGRRTDVLIADGLSRAVVVSPGAHTIVFKYQPASYFSGLALSGLALAALVALMVSGYRRYKASALKASALQSPLP